MQTLTDDENAARLFSDILAVDATGDEQLWVFRYLRYFASISGQGIAEAWPFAQEAWDAWGQDPSCTPEEIASSDYAYSVEDGEPA